MRAKAEKIFRTVQRVLFLYLSLHLRSRRPIEGGPGGGGATDGGPKGGDGEGESGGIQGGPGKP